MWYRDPVEIVRKLIGNPIFKDVMAYTLMQLVTITPLILSQFRGDKTAWPVYLTIGNISKDTRHELSSHSTILLGYLPVPKFNCFSEKLQSVMKYHLFHQCMSIILQSVVEAGKKGVPMVCTDSLVQLVHPIFAVYIVDYPEQCLISCCMENRCPICKVDPNRCGSHQPFDKWDVAETLSYLKHNDHGDEHNNTYDGNVNNFFKKDGVRPVYPPFWATLPHSDIFVAFTLDLLHQLHKGVFKDHLVKWCTSIIGTVAIDKAFQMVMPHPGLCHFKNGISHISQWMGSEHKEMEKVFLALVAAHACNKVIMADYMYQMTCWLQRQEAIDRFTKYLAWIRQSITMAPTGLLSAESFVAIADLDINGIQQESQGVDDQDCQWNDSGALVSQAAIGQTYHISKTHPPDLCNVPGEILMSSEGYHASQFFLALTSFLHAQGTTLFTPQTFDTFPLWRQVSFELPVIPEDALLDCALIRTGESNPLMDQTNLKGLRIGCVHVIFELPKHYPIINVRHPLVYIEWFTPFCNPDPITGFYHVSRSM
ncbi:hypothetical protein EDD18DRAFT_1312024 [Armillaria luteobubalina]|uniref:Uncharacterized protein n=1 Tax=Armillaria luteobubalina TaxID=153913 RepID=A0AA39UHI6_9AGAR|nr:hypothetical protein EDD18DRAFT_1312024 [Armillaria luteobubalina]